ncbi:hypothetical protein IVB30_41090 [Bradyrhizobium sp. 200]|uniref:hypothetical protein n=1 Tax=Bradyrhizobium sp. 200 TaxID=2782665 RepID=UPI001FFEBDD2|nr:hypothetical protein [Bradyrhizobium sp. 200]UPJ49272.1 hypothetical protein IVB30_41090 [Bradyrhizobium sp. 200]
MIDQQAYAQYLPIEKHELLRTALGSAVSHIFRVDELQDPDRSPLPFFAQAVGFAVIDSCGRLEVGFPIHYCLVRSDESAFSVRLNDWACVAVSYHFALRLFLMTSGLTFSEPLVSYRQDVRVEDDYEKRTFIDRQEMIRIVALSTLINEPQRPLAKMLTHVALNFIANHEFTHIVNGHLLGGAGAVLGENGGRGDVGRLLELRTLEYDADALAVQMSMHHFLGMARGTVECTPDEIEFLGNDSDAVHTAFAGACIAMCMIDALQSFSLPESPHGHAHPPATYRLLAMMSAAENALAILRRDGRLSLSADAVRAALTRVVRAIELAISEQADARPDPLLLAVEMGSRSEHDAEIYRCWTRLRPGLARYKLGGHLLAAAQYDLDGNPLPRSRPELRHMIRPDES